MLGMLTPLKAQPAKIMIATQQTLINKPLYIFHPAASTQRTFMSLKSSLPFLEIFIDHHHRIHEFRSTHRTSNSNIRVLLMPGPYLKAFSM